MARRSAGRRVGRAGDGVRVRWLSAGPGVAAGLGRLLRGPDARRRAPARDDQDRPPSEVAELCGPDALGCYGGDELVVGGDVVDGVTPEEIARHEYGHHVAAHRRNPPWRGLDWGPKRWATVEDVCRRAAAKTAFPADSGANYRLDPAEAFAEAYRAANEARAGIPFGWGLVDGSFYPDAAALDAVAQDVGAPWSAPTRQTLTRRFTAKGPRRLLVPVALPLDGEVAVDLRVPAGRLDELELVTADGRTVLARGLWPGRRPDGSPTSPAA